MKYIENFYPLLSAPPHKTIITMHQKPDGDAMGSTLGLCLFLKQFGHEVKVISPTNWAGFLDWMPGCGNVLNYESEKRLSDKLLAEAEWIFCLDFNVLHRTKTMERALLQANATKILIDHHEQPQVDAFDYGISRPEKSSTCEMLYDFICDSGHKNKINLDIAACLYTGMMTDTGSFRFPNTTASVHLAIAYLKEIGLNHSIIHENIYDTNTEYKLHLIGNSILNRLQVFYECNTSLMVISRQDLLRYNAQTGDTEGLVQYLMSIEGIKFGALVIDRNEERKWSFRSKGDFDVNLFARKHFNGGGHKNASGGNSKDSLEDTVKKFKSILLDYQSTLE